MYLCYIDESGTPNIPGNTSNFVLAGLSIPIWKWKICEDEIYKVKRNFELQDAEIHTGWIIRPYIEQKKVNDFEKLNYYQRRQGVERLRTKNLLALQKSPANQKKYHQTKKTYNQTKDYIHLTFDERKQFIKEILTIVGSWGFARIFAECIDKTFFDPRRATHSVDEQAFEQVVSRYEQYLCQRNVGREQDKFYGLLIHDNNQTVAKKHTELMKKFHRSGTLWTKIEYIIETPLFVNSQLTGLVQIADACAYAIRRYLENNEEDLFDEVFKRADRRGDIVVGFRHFTEDTCACRICTGHKQNNLEK